jgi:hypothetical protein
VNHLDSKFTDNLKGWKFRVYLLRNLPLGFLVKLKIDEISSTECITSVPFNWLTKNPFKSMYFAVQSMAAELSTATGCLVATLNQKPSIAFIIVSCKATFYKKATQRVRFRCSDVHLAYEAIESCKKTGEAVQKTFKTVGIQKDGTIVSEFEFTWSFKQRK